MSFPERPYPPEPLPSGTLVRRGKVRDVYAAGPGRLLLVASDRISAFDVVLSPGIPGTGVVLTQLSNFWFDELRDVTAHHLVSTARPSFPPPFDGLAELDGRAVVARAVRIVPIECVVRGYLIGSGWKEYQARGAVCGIALPPALHLADRLPAPIFTPSTKAEVGHDENISFDEVVGRVGGETAERLRDVSLRLYTRAAEFAEERGVIIADTKFEFGVDEDGALVWADEALTPDSSRFWPRSEYRAGSNPPSFDKQFVRDYLETSGWDKQRPAPQLPAQVIAGTQARYAEAYRRLTGKEIHFPRGG
ncbi:MAG: phosphoribosylaminoimidazolesuccinocarboxamide synthase [Candidatus Solibacter usitatus]|nr:phosphoribosylaminoimidazolesuccinocarboxamide synthase [Candidatus Solibacter usitatus]